MKFYEILTIVICVAIVVSTIVISIINKKKGKNSCCGNCSSCRSCASCKNENPNDKDNGVES